MPQSHRPRKGSLGFGPRTRASGEVPRISTWPESDGQSRVQGFAGYKTGMTHVVTVEDRADATNAGTETTVPVTIVETPAMHVAAVRVYEDTPYGSRPLTEAWAEDPLDDLERALDVPAETDTSARDAIRDAVEAGDVADVRLISYTDPDSISGIPKSEPDVMENRVGGDSIAERVEYALGLLEDDATYELGDVVRAGEFLDASGVTSGKGTEGPVKRWGVQKRKGKHARQGWRRRIGNLGPWNPSRVRSTVPQQGQTGYHQRTELNKRLLSLGDGAEINADGGFVNYGEVSGPYALIKGSLPGPTQRLLRFRPAVRPNESPRLDPEVRYVSTGSQQG